MLGHKTIHCENLGDDELWYSMKLPELLGEWYRAVEIQQLFLYVRDDSAMETNAKKAIDQLLLSPKPPPNHFAPGSHLVTTFARKAIVPIHPSQLSKDVEGPKMGMARTK